MKRWKVILVWCMSPIVLLWGCGRDNVGVQRDAAEWQSIMGGSKESRELNNIMMEEREEYIAGVITEEVLIERLTKRVELYLAENL